MDKRQEVIQAVEDGFNSYKENLSQEERDVIQKALDIFKCSPHIISIGIVQDTIKDIETIHNEYDVQHFPGFIHNPKNGKAALTYSLLDLLHGMIGEPRLPLYPDMIRERCNSKEEVKLRMTFPPGMGGISWE